MSALIRVAIRADAGKTLGVGHFARTSAVADILSMSSDTEIMLLTSIDSAPLAAAYFPPGIKLVSLAQDELDPEAAIHAMAKLDWTPDVIILDQYGSVPEWEILTANIGTPLVVFDDFDIASRADLIVRPHGGAVSGPETNVLRGPKYLPLSRHITDLPRRPIQDSISRLRLNICFGGSDPTNETAKALQAVADLRELDVDTVIGPRTQIDPLMIEAAGQMPHVTLHRALSPKQLAELMSSADLALGAGGVMLWERLCLGVPSLVISVAENQQAQIDTMVEAGAIRFLGEHLKVTSEDITQAITAIAKDETARDAIAGIGQNLVDGCGASRLAKQVQALALNMR